MTRPLFFLLLLNTAFGQSFAPAPGFPGSTAIYKDSNVFVNWASGVTINRGPMDLQNPGNGLAAYGVPDDALGFPDVQPVSFGDGGEAILTFPFAIVNGPGPDFAVFENGFTDHYMEFAHVEVSSDGVSFFRFASISEAPTDVQLTNFSFSNCAYVHNLAGKYRQEYGTPFDLEEMVGISGLDVNAVTHIRLIDVVGSIDSLYGTMDSQGNLINDPFPTAFESGGFDLDAIGVIHQAEEAGMTSLMTDIRCYPNPVEHLLHATWNGEADAELKDLNGKTVWEGTDLTNIDLDLSGFNSGVYFLHLMRHGDHSVQKIIKR